MRKADKPLKKFNSLSEPIKIAYIGAVATIAAAIMGAVIGGLFFLRSTTPLQPTPSSTVTATRSPQAGTTVTATSSPTSCSPNTFTPPPTVGAVQVRCQYGSEPIGVSDGRVAFDTNRLDGDLKRQAAQSFAAHDLGRAESLWDQAMQEDTSDAEVRIYLANQQAVSSPHFTIVIGTTLTGDDNSVAVGRENLQGAYLAQKKYNEEVPPGGMKVLLLIANSGSNEVYAWVVAQQIVNIAQNDRMVVGVMGWALSAQSLNAIGVLTQAHLPMVSTAASDLLTGKSLYFFRITPPASVQAQVAAKYAWQTLHVKTVAIFEDINNSYSTSLADDFSKAFMEFGGHVVATGQYTIEQPQTIVQPLMTVLQKSPGLLYLAGYPRDASVMFEHLHSTDPPVMGGNALYQLGGYAHNPLTGSGMKGHLYLTALAYHDEWNLLSPSSQPPDFFASYQQTYDPSEKHIANPYGYDLADSGAILAYDATSVLLYASSKAVHLTGTNLRQALADIIGKNAFQGVSGQISFGTNGDPMDKAVTVVCFTKESMFKLDVVQGKFLKDGVVLPGKPFGACS